MQVSNNAGAGAGGLAHLVTTGQMHSVIISSVPTKLLVFAALLESRLMPIPLSDTSESM